MLTNQPPSRAPSSHQKGHGGAARRAQHLPCQQHLRGWHRACIAWAVRCLPSRIIIDNVQLSIVILEALSARFKGA